MLAKAATDHSFQILISVINWAPRSDSCVMSIYWHPLVEYTVSLICHSHYFGQKLTHGQKVDIE